MHSIPWLWKLRLYANKQFVLSYNFLSPALKSKLSFDENTQNIIVACTSWLKRKCTTNWWQIMFMLNIRGFFSFEKVANVSTSNSLDFNKTTQTVWSYAAQIKEEGNNMIIQKTSCLCSFWRITEVSSHISWVKSIDSLDPYSRFRVALSVKNEGVNDLVAAFFTASLEA